MIESKGRILETTTTPLSFTGTAWSEEMELGRQFFCAASRNGTSNFLTTLHVFMWNRFPLFIYFMQYVSVFQEVEADSRTALQAVLESDLEREKLLEDEEILTAKLESGEEGVGDLLNKVFEKMELIEADSAPARASIILTGLGFSLEMQEKQTKEFSGGWRMRIALAQVLFTITIIFIIALTRRSSASLTC